MLRKRAVVLAEGRGGEKNKRENEKTTSRKIRRRRLYLPVTSKTVFNLATTTSKNIASVGWSVYLSRAAGQTRVMTLYSLMVSAAPGGLRL